MNENKKVLFIINKYSGSGYRPQAEGRLITQCTELGIEPSLEFTQYPGHAIEICKAAVNEKLFDVVFAVGGDGTVNEVAQGVVNTHQVMGIIPAGSGNGLGRHLGIPIGFTNTFSYLNSTSVIAMDSFYVNNRLSLNVSGIGFDGHIANLFGKNGKRGLLNYSRLVISEFSSFKEWQAEGSLDGMPFKKEVMVFAIANSSQFGNNVRVAPNALVCDGLLDISLIRKVSWVNAIGLASQLFRGTLQSSPSVSMMTGKEIKVRLTAPVPYHVDGEGMPPTKDFTIKINPGSVRMLVPLTVNKV